MPGMPQMGMPQMPYVAQPAMPQMPYVAQPAVPQQPAMPHMPYVPQVAVPQVTLPPVSAPAGKSSNTLLIVIFCLLAFLVGGIVVYLLVRPR